MFNTWESCLCLCFGLVFDVRWYIIYYYYILYYYIILYCYTLYIIYYILYIHILLFYLILYSSLLLIYSSSLSSQYSFPLLIYYSLLFLSSSHLSFPSFPTLPSHSFYTCRHLDILIYIPQESDPACFIGVDG